MADLNRDGKPDIVVANCTTFFDPLHGCLFGPYPGALEVLLGNGDGTFQTAVPYDSGGYYTFSIVVADVRWQARPVGRKLPRGVHG